LGGPTERSLSQDGRAYLLIFEDNSVRSFDLPQAGQVVIGRSPDVTLQLIDQSASRQHASLEIRGGELLLSDLGSRNGTRVNGERIAEPRQLITGDVISICYATLILCCQPSGSSSRSVSALPLFRQRLQAEIDRALRYQRSLSLLCLRIEATDGPRGGVVPSLASHLRGMDDLAWLGQSSLLILQPELSEEEVASAASRMSAVVEQSGLSCRAGFACCPADGSDVDTLVASAVAAATAATSSSRAVAAAQTSSSVTIGARRIVLVDPAMVRLYGLIEKLAPSDLPVLIQGETGTGKEIAASAVHHYSKRRGKPFVSVNCAALPENLVESELFGHERGAFSGAVMAKSGLLEAASLGTIFFDEVGELPLAIQAKLLRVVETQMLRRVGDVRDRPIDVRIVAATNRDLQVESAAGRFRMDLFFRLGAARLLLPPLRDRRRELPILARSLLETACTRLGRELLDISAAAMVRLQGYTWPGNIRELRNVMDFVAATVEGNLLLPWHLDGQVATVRAAQSPSAEAPQRFRPIDEEIRELERQRMAQALTAAQGVQSRAAELIAMPVRTFSHKLKQYQLGSQKKASDSE
jgi:DNA-binding NtrC family response regulator